MDREQGVGLIDAPAGHERLIGHHRGASSGPTMVVVAGIHGNEPAGIRAARHVLERLGREQLPVRGEIAALAGNLQALGRNQRFLVKDLNRQWTEDQVASLAERGPGPGAAPEDAEQVDLLAAFDEVARRARGAVHFLDLHTSSADGPPFLTIGDTLRNRRFASRLPCPLILGLEDQVDGSLLEYLSNRGHVTLGVEAGRHDLESSTVHHEAVLWLALVAAGMLDRRDLADAGEWERLLRQATSRVPRVIEIRHRHAVRPDEGFRMEPGFRNFQRVARGQLVAREARGEVRAHEGGLILLPLYQGQGEDGFFLGREVSGLRLRASELVRRLGLDRMMRWLPGVKPHPSRPRTLIVDTRVARLYPMEVFHLLGFRKVRMDGPRLIVTRRPFDVEGPERDGPRGSRTAS
jgi:succinylglutamate desuccinylase